jgi:polysaccharide deacetylase family protein (PEP-CTERM system associated)
MINALSIDIEEYFHPAEVQSCANARDWASLPSRVEPETDRVLEMLDRRSVSATFFVLGWVAERQPHLLRKIVGAGHDLGCHSYAHQLVYALTPAQFKQDLERAVAAIEDASGVTPRCYRAPSFSITAASLWALEILVEHGFQYDSSIFPITHDRYGIPGFGRHAQILSTPSGPITEVPPATTELPDGTILPVGGGGYLRLLPYRYTAAGLRRLNEIEKKPACIYFHPWEMDSEQPRLASGVVSRLRTYTGLGRMGMKIDRLLTEFRFACLGSVYSSSWSDARGRVSRVRQRPQGLEFTTG